jgi:hypothetical protein
MRLTYGQVGSYMPADGAHYNYVTTANGILEKEDNTNDEFIVPKRQHELLMKKDYGRYADENGELITCFISNNDITGWQQRQPGIVINGNGELIGIAFDGNWESHERRHRPRSRPRRFEPEPLLQRTISRGHPLRAVDHRQVRWCRPPGERDDLGGALAIIRAQLRSAARLV